MLELNKWMVVFTIYIYIQYIKKSSNLRAKHIFLNTNTGWVTIRFNNSLISIIIFGS